MEKIHFQSDILPTYQGTVSNCFAKIVAYLDANYTNITYKGKITATANVDDYVLEFTGIDYIYFLFESTSGSNTNAYVKAYLKSNIDIQAGTISGSALFSQQINMSNVPGAYASQCDVYIWADNNIMHAFTYCVPATFPTVTYVFDYVNKYIMYANNYILVDDSVGTKLNINLQGLYNFSESEKAIKRNVVITNGTAQNSNFIGILNGAWFYINSQFVTNTFALIEIDGVQYRQIYQNYIFIKN